MGSQTKTIFLLGGLTALLVLIGSFFGRGWTYGALAFALLLNFFTYWFSDRIVLKMYRAQPVTAADSPVLYDTVRQLSQVAGLPMPKVYLYPAANPNAFATGRDPAHAAVAVSTGLMEILSPEELKGVLGHELAHIKDRDILIATCAATLAAAITFLARLLQWGAGFFAGGDNRERGSNPLAMLAMVILAPLAALLIQMAVSRGREYLADDEGARFAGNPAFLANALRKLDSVGRRNPMVGANPATSHLFIVKPFSARGLMALFSTHPPIEARIARLEGRIT
ncbi:MAG TPA: zinc metalloprotease HtpX [bacterium]|uniref:Protease HtpX homolog n=1 Tax=candidate division TA06 bacterium ADurb.Bin417 TaxID=1852828 RepID=A0A1V5ML57_UNCT6|nr:MAG: hypothetical protein BWY73_00024 [candidate division TA06 bacterium ADurb.Bin417]HNS48734.1 zinc metalloprotease HtpX [bacterium]